jgi:nucleotide-binding universal stress UspA family protein
MYKHLLIATDGSELAQKAVDQGLGLAKALGAKVTAVTVSEPWAAIAPGEIGIAFPVDEYEKGAAENAARVLAAVVAAANARDTTSRTASRPTASWRPPRPRAATSSSWQAMAAVASRALFSAARPTRS